MKFGFYTLGCKVNQYETKAMERRLLQRGQEIGTFEGDCNAYVVNTCSVTAVAGELHMDYLKGLLGNCRRCCSRKTRGNLPRAMRQLLRDLCEN